MMSKNTTAHQMNENELKAYRYVRNRLVHYNSAPSVRDVMRTLNLKSPRSAEFILNKLIESGLLARRDNGKLRLAQDIFTERENPTTVDVPLVGTVAAGTPILAEQNIEAVIPVDNRLVRGSSKYFLLRVSGKSMDQKGINDGDFVLVRQQQTADRGDIVVALIDEGATVKEFVPADDAVILRPHSSDKSITPIVLHDDFQIQGKVVQTLPSGALA